ncbi:MAG: TMEM175 family protein [Blastococcus sp.]
MSHTRERPAAGRLHSPGRLEAFGDGVFAIAITLLVLEIAVPAVSGGELLHALGRQWPAYLAYGMSFFSIGVLWIVHYGVTRALRGVDALFLRLNLLFLFFVAFLPYPTRLLAEFLTDKAGERVAVTVYALTLFAISLTLRLLWHYATDGRRLIADDITDEQITADNTTLTPALGFYAVAVGLGLLAPWRRSHCSRWRSSSSPPQSGPPPMGPRATPRAAELSSPSTTSPDASPTSGSSGSGRATKPVRMSPSQGRRRRPVGPDGDNPGMVAFFLPRASDDDQAERLYDALAEFAGCEPAPADRRVHAIAFTHDGAQWVAEVGEALSGVRTTQQLRRGELLERTEHLSSSSRVLAVYPGTPFVVVTDAQPITGAASEWANPFLAQPDRVTYFDAPVRS